jgi:hypothetical protein
MYESSVPQSKLEITPQSAISTKVISQPIVENPFGPLATGGAVIVQGSVREYEDTGTGVRGISKVRRYVRGYEVRYRYASRLVRVRRYATYKVGVVRD